MKLKLPQYYGQREPQWVNKFLGYNTSQPWTIGNYGCLISSLASYIGERVDDVNEILKDNNGFVNGGDFVWGASIVLGLNEMFLSQKYTKVAVPDSEIERMKGFLNEGRPILTHIDFNPTTDYDDMHWILVNGYEGNELLAFDPWTDSEISLTAYGGTKRAVIQYRVYDKKLNEGGNMSDMMEISKEDFGKLVTNSGSLDLVTDYLELPRNSSGETIVIDIKRLERMIDNESDRKDEAITDLNKANLIIEDKDKKIAKLEKQLEGCGDTGIPVESCICGSKEIVKQLQEGVKIKLF